MAGILYQEDKAEQPKATSYLKGTRFLQNKTAEVLEKEDLEHLWYLLKEHLSQPDDGTERINYD